MKTKLLGMVAAIALAAVAGQAQAALLSLSGGVSGVIPGGTATNEALFLFGKGVGDDIGGYYDAQVTAGAGVKLRFDFFGGEHGATNSLEIDGVIPAGFTQGPTPGTGTFGTLATPLATSLFTTTAAGDIPFRFLTSFGPGVVANGTNGSDPNRSFFASFDPFAMPGAAGDGGTTGKVLWLFLDDGGAGPNDNHDDYVVRITAVPEPATLAMLGLGLVGMGVVARRRRV
jgi:hypothetical protein